MQSATAPTPSTNWSLPASPTKAAADSGFGIYVHWPFCQSLCPYCDFNSHVRARVEQRRWAAAYVAELSHFAQVAAGRCVTSVFFGGGTPSLMDADTVDAVLVGIRRHWAVAPDVEVSLEANPSSVDAARFREYRQAGVNRLSLGVQALNDADLRTLGRRHSRYEALAAIDTAAHCFDRVSVDLIYGRPGQTAADWRGELQAAVGLAGGHVAAYQLTIEPGTPFHAAQRRGALRLPDEATVAELYETTQQVLTAAGLPAYEISNHARPGQACCHNLNYWQYSDFVGVGPGAHGRLTTGDGRIHASRQHRSPEAWLERVEADGNATQQWAALDTATVRDELFMMGLRLTAGVRAATVRARLSRDIADCFSPSRLQRLVDGGFLDVDANGIRATAAGRQRLDAVLGDLLAS